MPNRKFVSLFCGCGGFDLGFQAAGFEPVAAFDSDPLAIRNYKRNISPHAQVVDLTKEFPISQKQAEASVLLAGPPCQGFSLAGRRNPNDARNNLLPLVAELSAKIKPRVIVVENVVAVLSGQQSRYWAELGNRLRNYGYSTRTTIFNALELGLAQRRQRLFLFAWQNNNDFDIIVKSLPRTCLKKALNKANRQTNHDPKPLLFDSRLFRIAKRISPGQKLSNVRGGPRSVHTWDIPEVFGFTSKIERVLLEKVMRLRRSERRRASGDADPVDPVRLTSEFGEKTIGLLNSLCAKGYLRRIGTFVDLTHTFNGKPRRFQWESVSCTVDTRFGNPHFFLHPSENRPYTVREAARLQGFPDSYFFEGSDKDHFRQIGNAVPPVMARAAAEIAIRVLGQ